MSNPTVLIDLKEVMRRFGVSKATVYRMVKAGELSAPVRLRGGKGGSRWREADVENRITALAAPQ